jgi:hypothetical protein
MRLEASVGISAAPQDGQPRGNKIGRPTESQALALADTIEQIRKLEDKITKAKKEAWSYIATLEDPFLRQIIIFRFIDGKSWLEVARNIGGNSTADSCRMAFNRMKIDD